MTMVVGHSVWDSWLVSGSNSLGFTSFFFFDFSWVPKKDEISCVRLGLCAPGAWAPLDLVWGPWSCSLCCTTQFNVLVAWESSPLWTKLGITACRDFKEKLSHDPCLFGIYCKSIPQLDWPVHSITLIADVYFCLIVISSCIHVLYWKPHAVHGFWCTRW